MFKPEFCLSLLS